MTVEPVPQAAPPKQILYEIMEGTAEDNLAAAYFRLFMTVIILVNVFAVIIETVEPIRAQYFSFFLIIDIVSISIFTVEYILRIWICTLNPRYSYPVTGRLRYAVSPMALIDLFAFLPFYIPFVIPLDLRFLRILRLFRLIRLLKLGRYSDAMRTFQRVLYKSREELLLSLTILLVVLVMASSIMYYAERDVQPDKFLSIPHAMWWGIVTLATVGYGDVYPVTTMGKIVAAIVVVTGIAIFALPTAILSAAFIEEVQRQKMLICPNCGYHISGDAEAEDDPEGENFSPETGS
ncbi:MAG: ion transporter [Methanoregula sp.]|nr:ion transporter [Methanoregula sp.]